MQAEEKKKAAEAAKQASPEKKSITKTEESTKKSAEEGFDRTETRVTDMGERSKSILEEGASVKVEGME